MNKSIYCIKWSWYDENDKVIPNTINTHSWFTSFPRAQKEFNRSINILYGDSPDRLVKNDQCRTGFCPSDGTYELQARKIHAHQDQKKYLRIILAAADLN